MLIANYPGKLQWTWWEKILFRFFFILFTLYISPWTFLDMIPGAYNITQYYYQFQDWSVITCNRVFFHVREVLVPFNGSGDTSYGYAQLDLYLSLAIIGTIVWSILGRKAQHYNGLSYWFRLFARYFVLYNCFLYGIDKIFLLQMPFPNTSQLATPLGDFLPMRLSWMFMGYSNTYQFFSGLLEVFAGCLLLFRRTTTLGLFFAGGIFLNVMMMNLSYDIPVKLFSAELFLLCIFLLSFEAKRIASFFILNRISDAASIYYVYFEKRWMRITRIILKLAFIILAIIIPTMDMFDRYIPEGTITSNKNLPNGVYDVNTFVRNHDTIPCSHTDSLRWQDLIVDSENSGSIKTSDTLFRQRYGRGYFNFTVNEHTQEIELSKSTYTADSIFIAKLKYTQLDSTNIQLQGIVQKDTLFVNLKKTKRHFQLAERQFHWLSEYNR